MLSVDFDENLPKLLEKPSAPTASPSASGELPRKFERFTLLTRVARGGMGEVYLATARSIEGAERPLIVKIVRPDHAEDRSFVARFLDEARIQAQLSHPGVAQILEATEDAQGMPYVVVEYVEGKNLSEIRSRAGQLGVRMTWPEGVAIGVCLGEALTHVHERTDAEGRPLDIVHRDLSPQNVMVGFGGEVKLIDFGTARAENRRCQTVAGIVFAKPGYVAPEVANSAPGGVPADLYAFGVILWELLAGRRFLTGEAAQHMAAVGAGKRTLPPLAKLIGAPMELDQLLARLTATAVEERYPSARAATADLVKLLQRAPSLADGDRSVRGRNSDLMRRLYPAEPARSRADFARRVAEARSLPTPEPFVASPSAEAAPLAPEDPELLKGTRYRLGREIGRGAMGIVHEAIHVDLGRTAALKLLCNESMSPLAQSRFRAEARAIAAVDQENLVKIYDFGACHDGRLYYAMELLEGESLDKRLAREKRLPEKTVIELGIMACRALEAAHRAGVVHRDIKPANLFLTSKGKLKVLDFGVAKSGTESLPTSTRGQLYLLGTPEYMAPEQAHGEADARSDVYALGAVLYELVTGVLPFDGEGPLAILAQKSASVPPRPTSLLPKGECSAAFERVLLRALESAPERRQPDVATLLRELETSLVAGERTPKTDESRARRRLGVVALGFTMVGCLGLMGFAGAQHPALRDSVEDLTARARGSYEELQERWQEARERRALVAKSRENGPRIQAARPVTAPVIQKAPTPPPVAPAAPPQEPAHDPESAQALGYALETGMPPMILEVEEEEAPVAVSQAPARPAAEPRPAVAEPRPAVAQARPKASRSKKVNPAHAQAQAALARAEALTQEGKPLRALELLRKTAERYANVPGVLRALSHALAKDRSWGEAVRVARRAAEIDKSPEVRLDLARLERATGNRERAIAVLRTLVEDDRTSGPAREMLRQLTGTDRVALRD